MVGDQLYTLQLNFFAAVQSEVCVPGSLFLWNTTGRIFWQSTLIHLIFWSLPPFLTLRLDVVFGWWSFQLSVGHGWPGWRSIPVVTGNFHQKQLCDVCAANMTDGAVFYLVPCSSIKSRSVVLKFAWSSQRRKCVCGPGYSRTRRRFVLVFYFASFLLSSAWPYYVGKWTWIFLLGWFCPTVQAPFISADFDHVIDSDDEADAWSWAREDGELPLHASYCCRDCVQLGIVCVKIMVLNRLWMVVMSISERFVSTCTLEQRSFPCFCAWATFLLEDSLMFWCGLLCVGAKKKKKAKPRQHVPDHLVLNWQRESTPEEVSMDSDVAESLGIHVV